MNDLTRLVKCLHAIKGDVESIKNDVRSFKEEHKQPILPCAQACTINKQVHWITAQSAADLINVHRQTIENYAAAGKISKDLINGLWHYLESDVLKYDKRTEAQKRK